MRIVDHPNGSVVFYRDDADVEIGRVLPPARGFSVEQLNQLYEEQGWTLEDLVRFAEHMREREATRRHFREAIAAR